MRDPLRRWFRCTLGMLILIGSGASAQVAQRPPRDRLPSPTPPAVGTGVIRGRVIDGRTRDAIARARVRLDGGMQPRAPALTDEAGAFVFKALPAGTYSITVDKPTYMTSHYPVRGETLRTVAQPLTLADGQLIDGLTVSLFRGGVIAGRVVDAHGDPAEGAAVQALRVSKSGRGRPQMRVGAVTNDLGEFRLAHLEPGRYLIFVTPPRRDAWADMYGYGENDATEFQPAPTFYPGVPSLEQAQPITIDRGGSATGLELALIESQTATITGIIVNGSGDPVSGNLSLVARPIVRGLPNVFGAGGSGVKPDGTFRLRLAPGEYELEANAYKAWTGGSPTPGSEQFGSARLTVGGDISGLVIQLGSGARISGRVVFDGSSQLSNFPPDREHFPLLSGSTEGINCRPGRTELAADYTFTVDGVFGTCSVQLSGVFGRWSPKSVLYNGAEMLDQVVTFAAGQWFRDVHVIMTDKRTEVSLQVTDERGHATREFAAVLFTVDKARWTDGSRSVRTFVPEPDSANTVASRGGVVGGVALSAAVASSPVVRSREFSGPASLDAPLSRADTIVGLPPGEYFAIAVDDMDADAVRDPDTLERLSRGAVRITLTEGTKLDVSLRRIRLLELVADR